ncbi:MAG: helix-turn-helix domain-containing protein [Pseudonocardiaceae bacterium]
MGQQPKELTPHESLHHYWGAELRALRIARGLSLAELGQQVHCNPSYLAKIERAERPIPGALVESCDRALDAAGTLVRLHALAEAEPEQAAEPTHVASEDIHVANQAGNLDGEIIVPARTPDGRVVFVSVPRRVFLQGIGSAAVGLATTSLPLPTGASLPAVGDAHPVEHFQQMRKVLEANNMLFGPRRVIPVVREQIAIKDLSEYQLAESWLDRALGLSHLVGDRDLTAYILASKSELAGDMRVAADAIGAGEQAMKIATPRSRMAALAATRAARGHAINGDEAATQRSYDRARELLHTSDNDPDSPGGHWLNEDRLTLSQAHSWTLLGEYRRAVESFEAALTTVPNRLRLSRGAYLARAALAHAGDHEVENAATVGMQALGIAADTKSGRILTDLIRLDDTLARWKTTPAVADFRVAVRETISGSAAIHR